MKETREETYKKIYIKSDVDLPGKEGWFTTNQSVYTWYEYKEKKWKSQFNGVVVYDIDWYLQPQEQEKPQTAEEFAKMKNGTFMQIGCINAKRDLWANINCENYINPATCGRETSCLKCNKYKVVYTDEAIERRAHELAKIHSKQSVGDFAVGYLFGIKEPIKFKK